MKIIVRYCLPWGNFSNQAVYVEADMDIEEIRQQVEKKFEIKPKWQVLKYKRDGFTVNTHFPCFTKISILA